MSQKLRPFSEVVKELVPDGSLRDFYIHGVTIADWDKFLVFVSSLNEKIQVKQGEQCIDLPSSFERIRELQKENHVILRITVAGGILCCHFFCDDEIELDFLPQDFNSEGKWNALVDFLQRIVKEIGRKGLVTDENAPEFVIQEIA